MLTSGGTGKAGRFMNGDGSFRTRRVRPGCSRSRCGTAAVGRRTLYVHIEQGLGDSIQFYRFVRLAKRSGRVVLGVSERLAALFASQPDAPEVIVTGQPMPRFDYIVR